MERIMDVKNIPIGEIVPYARNAKKHDKRQIDNVAESIRQYGFVQPVVIDRDGVIVIGHCRVLAAKKLGMKAVPCVCVDDLTPEQVNALRLVDNKTNESDWDMDLLSMELPEIDLSAFDFDWGLTEDDSAEIVEDEVPEVSDDPPTAKRGDVWQLGRHRLMCGDSTDREDIERLIGARKADLVFTDPPYGIDIVKGTKIGGDNATHFGKVGGNNIVKASTYMPINGDDTTNTARLNYEIVKCISSNQIIFGGNYFTDFLPPKSCWCIWDKENTGNFADVEMAWTSFDKGAKLYRWLWNGLCRKGERNIEGTKRVHPTQKPVGLIAKILEDFTENGEIVFDCFGGSGSTLIACEQINRVCYMMEYEPYYVDVIVKRWETFTGEKAVLLHDD